MLTRIPPYLFLLFSLTFGMILGGFFPEPLKEVANFVNAVIGLVIDLVPILIFIALSPAISSLTDSGRANSLAGSVILWYLFTSFLAGFLGLSISTLIFGLSFSTSSATPTGTILTLLTPGDGLNPSRPLIAILLAICFGL
ncbi:uncharacterized protein METZ01_LOCUS389450, partial [marine metagenome]